jgi:hypothetical protein
MMSTTDSEIEELIARIKVRLESNKLLLERHKLYEENFKALGREDQVRKDESGSENCD